MGAGWYRRQEGVAQLRPPPRTSSGWQKGPKTRLRPLRKSNLGLVSGRYEAMRMVEGLMCTRGINQLKVSSPSETACVSGTVPLPNVS